jgi:hypothetical protein
MKKTYIIPSVEELYMDTEKLAATSIVIDSGKEGGDALVKENDWDIFGTNIEEE